MEFIGIHEANYLEALKGLSDPCPLVIENTVNKIFGVMGNQLFAGAIVFNGWNGIGKERILKYVAKRAMEAKSFDIVIWIIEKRKASSIRIFQMRIAEQLGIAFPKNDDSDDDEEEDGGSVDEIVSGRITACLETKKFVLVHNGNWGLMDLKKMGIPVSRGVDYAMVLVVSNYDRDYHKNVSLNELISDGFCFWDLVYEECIDIANSPNLRIGDITPNDVMRCLLFTYFFKNLSDLARFWFVIGDASFDVKTTFGCVQVMLKELSYRFRDSANALNITVDCFGLFIVYMVLFKIAVEDRTPEQDIVGRLVESILCISDLDLDLDDDGGVDGFKTKMQRRFSVKAVAVKTLSLQVLSNLSTIIFSHEIKELPEDIFDNMTNVRCIAFSNTSIKSFPQSMLCLTNLRFLNLRSCQVLEFSDNIFEGLDSLRFLDLSECSQLISLPSSIFCLINLEHLYLRSCENLSVLPSSIQTLEKLQVLQMTGTKLIEIPEQFFKSMNSLKQLDLSSNPHLTSIHTSSFSNILPNLQILNLSSVPISQLSLKNRSSLETITLSNKNLEKLDLSNTNINKFPIQGDQNLIPLKQLELVNTKHLIKVDWKDIKWLPQEVNWTQCGDGRTSHMYIQPFQQTKDGNRDGVFISVGNANIFRTLTPSSTLWAKSMSRFVVYVCPCEEHGKGKALTPRRATLRYDDIFSKFKRSIPSYERCLEIERVNKLPKGISGILSHAQFFILHDEKIIMRLSDLGVENMGELRECWLERCHAMQAVFSVGAKTRDQPMLKCLEKLQISNLMKLTHMCYFSGRKLENGSFGQLKHLQIEHCPRLVNVFSSSVCLKSLEVLEIKFCARLEEIFFGKENEEDSLPQLKTLCLLELPVLKNIIHNVWLVSLKEAKIKGCPRLRELPLRSDSNIQNNKQKDPRIVVKCELELWEQLEWKDKNVKQQVYWKPFQIPKRG